MPGPREPSLTPYMIAFGREVNAAAYRRVVMVTAAQSGKTDTFLDVLGVRFDQRPAPTIYVAPTRDMLVDQFEPRLMELFSESTALGRKLLRGRAMKKTLKWIAGARLRLAHSGSPTALKSDPAALAIVDEYDAMLKNVRRQGDPLRLVEARGETYADFCVAIASTPSLGFVETEVDEMSGLEFWKPADQEELESPIWALWQEGTRFHWAWPCPHCHEYFIPRRKHLTWPPDLTPAQARRAAVLSCPKCGADIIEDAKAGMNAAGLYVAPGQRIVAGAVEGLPPDSSTCSFWVSGLASPFRTWGERAEDLRSAELSADSDRMQTVVNSRFGEVYSQGGGEVPEWREVLEHRLPYSPRTIPTGVVFLSAGIDVQKNRLVYVVRGWGERATSWLIDNGEIWGETAGVEVWQELDELLSTDFDGMLIKVALIDSGYRPGKEDTVPEHRVYEFCRLHQRFVFPAKGTDVMQTPFTRRKIEVTPRGASKYGLELIRLSTDHWKLWVHEHIRWPPDHPGAWYLHDEADEKYARQVVSEARTKSPIGRPVWVVRSRENHYLDCESMAAAAAFMLGAQRLGSRYAAGEDMAAAVKQASVATREAAGAPADRNGQPAKDTAGTTATFRDFAARMNSRYST